VRRAIIGVVSAGASFAVAVGLGGGTGALSSLAHDLFSSQTPVSGASKLAPGTTTAPTYAPVAPTTVPGRTVDYGYGELQLAVTFEDHRIASVTVEHFVAADGYSAALEADAVPVLTRELLTAQDLAIDVVTGATYTSEAYAQSLQAVLDREELHAS
jgi:uncharacterized protein with FMN-binding domain